MKHRKADVSEGVWLTFKWFPAYETQSVFLITSSTRILRQNFQQNSSILPIELFKCPTFSLRFKSRLSDTRYVVDIAYEISSSS